MLGLGNSIPPILSLLRFFNQLGDMQQRLRRNTALGTVPPPPGFTSGSIPAVACMPKSTRPGSSANCNHQVHRPLRRCAASSSAFGEFRLAFRSELRSWSNFLQGFFTLESALSPLSLGGKQEGAARAALPPPSTPSNAARIGAVDQAMIVTGERERQDQPRLNFPANPLRLHARPRRQELPNLRDDGSRSPE